MEQITIEHFRDHPQGRCTERYVKKNLPRLYDELLEIPGKKYAERIYKYFVPGSGVCVVCGAPTKFKNINTGFCKCCSQKCASTNPDRADKIRRTTNERYGVDNISQLQSVKRAKEDTCMRNYGVRSWLCQQDQKQLAMKQVHGVEFPAQSERIKEKMMLTCMKNHGVSWSQSSSSIRQKSSDTKLLRYGDANYNNREQATATCQDRYGVSNPFQLPQVPQLSADGHARKDSYKKMALTQRMNAIAKYPDVISSDNGQYTCRCPHPDCTQCDSKNFDINISIYHQRKATGVELCTKLRPVGKFCKNTSIEEFVRNVLEECGIQVPTNHSNRTILNGMELDFYIPSHNLAIECNGCFWHSDKYKDRLYHMSKYEICASKGIQLLTIWEDQIKNYPERVSAIIKSKLSKYSATLYARDCVIRPITTAEAKQVLQWHLQGHGLASVKYGLFYDDTLVSVMTFSKLRKFTGSKEDAWELVRYCVMPEIRITGGASRMLSHFIKDYSPKRIISFSSNDISDGRLYKTLGFTEAGRTSSYWYVKPNTFERFHRYAYRKSELVKHGADPSKTEFEITDEMGLYRFWDSGQTKWVLEISEKNN